MSDVVFGVGINRHEVRAIAGLASASGLAIIGTGICPTSGVGMDGAVTSAPDLAASVRAAVGDAESAAEARAQVVELALPGCLARSEKAFGRIGLAGRPAATADLERLQTDVLGELTEREHVFESRLLSIGLTDALSADGSIELSASYLIVAAKRRDLDGHRHAVSLAGYEIARTVLAPLAAADALLGPADKDQGVILLHLEDCFSDVVVYQGGVLQHLSTVSIARLGEELDRVHGRDVMPSLLVVTGESVDAQEAALQSIPQIEPRRCEPDGLPPELTALAGLLMRGRERPRMEGLRLA